MGKSKKSELTQDEILAWADGISGVSRAVSGQRLGVDGATVSRWRKKVGEWISEKFDINEYRMPLYGLYPLWLNSVMHNLKKNDVTLTVAFGKGMQLFQEKTANDLNLNNLSDADLLRLIATACDVKPGSKEPADESGD